MKHDERLMVDLNHTVRNQRINIRRSVGNIFNFERRKRRIV